MYASPSTLAMQFMPFVRSNGFRVRVSVTDNRRSIARWLETRGSSPQRAVPARTGNVDVGARPGAFSAFHRAVRTLPALVLGSLPSPARFTSSVLLHLYFVCLAFHAVIFLECILTSPPKEVKWKTDIVRTSCIFVLPLPVIPGHRRSSPVITDL